MSDHDEDIYPADFAVLLEKTLACAKQISTNLAKEGNTKSGMLRMIELGLNRMDENFPETSERMSMDNAVDFNLTSLMLRVLVRVAFNDPMYDSDDLTLQIQNELDNILSTSEPRLLAGQPK